MSDFIEILSVLSVKQYVELSIFVVIAATLFKGFQLYLEKRREI